MIIVRILALVCGLICMENMFNIFQLKDYKPMRYFKALSLKNTTTLLGTILLILSIKFSDFSLIFYTLSATFLPIFFYNTNNKKTPLKITKRISHDMAIFMCLSIIITMINPATYLCLFILLPALSNCLNFVDNYKNHTLIKSAKRKIENSKAKVIAITGSNGKTTIKNFLSKMLSQKYNVIASPKSYNTPIGNAVFINDCLKENTDFIILEYGARKRGDIRHLCKMFGADYGIISCVAPQHLEYFHSIENIYLTKKELSDFLGNNPCVFNGDNIHTIRMYNQKKGIKLITKRPTSHTENLESHFSLYGKSITSKILGEENVSDILMCAKLAEYLGLRQDEIIKSITELTPVPHRLNLIKTDINILDDSYNCSIASAKQSIDILLTTKNRKMIVTPGIIEGGKSEYSINYKLGQMLNGIDYIIIVGNHNKHALSEGIKSNNTSSKIIYSKSLDEAKKYFSMLNAEDTLLILNDLPDCYN